MTACIDYRFNYDFQEDVNTRHGVVDERAVYFLRYGLIPNITGKSPDSLLTQSPPSRTATQPANDTSVVVPRWAIGYVGYSSGPHTHILDLLGLGDPLLARLPISIADWRPGHYERTPPFGYQETLETGENVIVDSNLARYYDRLSMIIRGKIFSWKRLVTLMKFNLGAYNDYLDDYLHPPIRHISARELYVEVKDPKDWKQDDIAVVPSSGMIVRFDSLRHAARLEVACERTDTYQLTFFSDSLALGSTVLPKSESFVKRDHLQLHTATIPDEARARGFNQIEIVPVSGDGLYRCGHLRLLDE